MGDEESVMPFGKHQNLIVQTDLVTWGTRIEICDSVVDMNEHLVVVIHPC